MGYAPSPENKVNIHVGYLRGRSKTAALGAFAAAADLLSDACRARLTVENDDRPSLFSVADLLPLHRLAGIPLVRRAERGRRGGDGACVAAVLLALAFVLSPPTPLPS